MDSKNTAQVSFFVRGVNKSFDVTEELATVIPLKVTAQGSDLFEAVMTNLNSQKLNLNSVSDVMTDGAPYMCGNRQVLFKFL